MAAINSAEMAEKLGMTHSRVKTFIKKAGIKYATDGQGGYVFEEADFTKGFDATAKSSKTYKHKKRKTTTTTTTSSTTAQKKKRAAA